MEDYYNTKKILGGSFKGKRPAGRHCSRGGRTTCRRTQSPRSIYEIGSWWHKVERIGGRKLGRP